MIYLRANLSTFLRSASVQKNILWVSLRAFWESVTAKYEKNRVVTEVTRISVQPLSFINHTPTVLYNQKIQRIRNYEKCRNQYKITNTSKKTEKRTNGVWLKFTLTVSWLNVKRNELFLTDKNCKKHWPTRLSLYQKTWQIT